MSWPVQKWVWENSPQKGNALIVLLAIADYCFNDDGTGAFPSLEKLAKKARLSERDVRYRLRELEETGAIICRRKRGPNGVNLYEVIMEGQGLPVEQPAGTQNGSLEGQTLPVEEEQMAPQPAKSRRQPAKSNTQPATAVAPEPLLEPLLEPKNNHSEESKKATLEEGERKRLIWEQSVGIARSPELRAQMEKRFPSLGDDIPFLIEDCIDWCEEQNEKEQNPKRQRKPQELPTKHRITNWLKREIVWQKPRASPPPKTVEPVVAEPRSRRRDVKPTPAEADVWKDALAIIEGSGRVSRANFEDWFSRTALVELTDTSAVIMAPNTTVRDWLEGRMGGVIHEALCKVLNREDFRLKFEALEALVGTA